MLGTVKHKKIMLLFNKNVNCEISHSKVTIANVASPTDSFANLDI